MEERIKVKSGKLDVPNHPTIPYIIGDGIGVDITPVAKEIADAAIQKSYRGKKSIDWIEVFAGQKAKDNLNQYLPPQTLALIKRYRACFKGPLTTPVGGGFRSLNVAIRQEMDLHAIIRPAKYIPGIPSPMKDPKLDLIIFREAVEDVYSGVEWKMGSKDARKVITYLNKNMKTNIYPASGIGVKPISKMRTQRVMDQAVRYAIENKRKSITIMHKGNIMKYTEGAFREWCYDVAKKYKRHVILESNIKGKVPKGKIVVKDRIADSIFQQILLRPAEYDIIVSPNLNGDYLSDAAAAQVGGIGMTPSAQIGKHIGVFEPTHGTAPKYAGQDKVNPTSSILSAKMMLEFIGWREPARLIERAVEKTIKQKKVTYDLHRLIKGAKKLKTSEFGAQVIKNL